MRAKFGAIEQTHGIRLRAKFRPPQFLRFFFDFGISGVAYWQQSEKVEHEWTTTNLPLLNGIQIVSVLQHLHCELRRVNCDVQKRDGQTDKQTDKETQRFWLSEWRVKSEPHQTWHGDRGPQTRSCTSKTFGDLTHSFTARGR